MKEDFRVICQGLERVTFKDTDGKVLLKGIRHFTVLDTGEEFVEPFVNERPLPGIVTCRSVSYRRNGRVKEDITF